jgi:adenine C2-methylase RlmN of 23S rRNA A2503 and tRNA A37
MGCKFCWLTETSQTKFNHVTIEEYADQLNDILKYASEQDKLNEVNSRHVRVNLNMMARGEALANRHIIKSYREFYDTMEEVVDYHSYGDLKVNISTIMPDVIKDVDLREVFKTRPAYLYYSLYSLNTEFREEWLKNAMGWNDALTKLKLFCKYSDLPLTLHFCLIEGQNDNLEDVRVMCETIKEFEFSKLKFNIVKYNPHPSSPYKETSIEKSVEIFNLLQSISSEGYITSTNKSRIVPRAGPDVYASCGMFIEDQNL